MLQILLKWSPLRSFPKYLDFIFWLYFYKSLKLFKPLKPLSFGFHHVNLHLPWQIIKASNKIFCPSHGHILYGSQTPKCTISKGLLLISPHHCPTLPHITYPPYTLRKTNAEVEQKVYPRFIPLTTLWSAKMLFKSKCLNRQCQTPPNCPLHMNAWSWPHMFHIPPWRSFGIIPFTLRYCNHITIGTSHNAFIYVKSHFHLVQ